MRGGLLWGAARVLWAGRAVGAARRPLSCSSPPLEELFARGGPLRTFLERQAGSEAQLRVKGPELVAVTKLLSEKERELRETEHLLHDENEDLRKLAENEIILCQKEITQLKHQIICLLVPSEETDESDLILEVTAGVGGQEAMLFTSEMFDMYQQYAAFKRWHFETLEYFPSEIGGLRHASASIGGSEAYKHMKFEGGVHRVQRVPKTEKQGRIHTSTMTVAILPQPTEINLVINPKDLRIDTKRASGAGGQHVNTTDSAVRIVHLPTGVVSECQQERSQLKNREMAMKKLRAKLYNMHLEEETSKRYSARKIQVGTKGRSEKIRTYNFPQNRVTDHRINKSLHGLETFMQGDYLLDELIQSLKDYADYEYLLEIISKKA
ncbi:peptide chain release factor 1-like, mitochondrial isoform X1 [Marmota marmota marmota]|uniref:Peptide chain release factor 1-like, mitochondrial n=2 Tax=Marmota marmota marmota TaxID=9994 RepID=A0A8C5YSL7_MARMA|nr:peptide chain release factor 1-like, mitochondrial isoform X1 [Marmota marmota marmota]XP_027795359.1 peptide chain release factor 1-like, mitochondrial isoform X1 [Marmota flaviventris]